MNRKFLMAGISALALTAAGSAMADDSNNDIFIDQQGTSNVFNVDQTNGDGNTVGFEEVTNTQGPPGAPGDVLQSGTNNTFNIRQEGNDNVVGSQNSFLAVEQEGSNNSFDILQDGNRNTVFDALQDGTDGSIDVDIVGNDNLAGGVIRQADARNNMVIDIHGNRNGEGQAQARQAGTDQDMDILINGNRNDFDVDQGGNDNRALVDIVGNRNDVIIDQGDRFNGGSDFSRARINITNGADNTVDVSQTSSGAGFGGSWNNDVDVDVTNSDGNSITLDQGLTTPGVDNYAKVNVRGFSDNNTFMLSQDGDLNSMDIELIESDNNAFTWSQMGTSNTLIATLNNADGGTIDSSQNGTNLTANICQGSGC